jgi:hypothetical protein
MASWIRMNFGANSPPLKRPARQLKGSSRLSDLAARLSELERDWETLLASYAGMVPEALNDLDPEERHRLYKLLALEVKAYPDKSLELSGTLGTPELLQIHESRNTQLLELRFRALLGHEPEIEPALV